MKIFPNNSNITIRSRFRFLKSWFEPWWYCTASHLTYKRLFKGVNWYPKRYTLLLHFPIQCYCKYPAEVVPHRNPSPGLCLRDRSLFIVRGGGGGGVAEDFFCDNGALTWFPLTAYNVVLIPPHHIGGGRFHDSPPPRFYPSHYKKPVFTISKQVTSIFIILTSHEPWTTTSHIWSSDMNWIVCSVILGF